MKKDIKFEQAIESLDIAVSKLEGGELSLDESIKVFEEAIALIKTCNEKLSAAEQRVRVLIESQDGSVTDAPFDIGSNEN